MRKLAKILMMMALVFGAASCSDVNDMPDMPTPPTSDQENSTKAEEPELPSVVKSLMERASGYDNISIVNNATMMRDSIDGKGVMIFDMSSFEGFKTVIYIDDSDFYYDVYIPSEGAQIKLKDNMDIYLGLSDFMYLNKDHRNRLSFKKELLGLRCDCDDNRHKHGEHERDYYYKSYNDYMVGIYDSPQVLQLEILPNHSGSEQILSFFVWDGLPVCSAGINFIQEGAK